MLEKSLKSFEFNIKNSRPSKVLEMFLNLTFSSGKMRMLTIVFNSIAISVRGTKWTTFK